MFLGTFLKVELVVLSPFFSFAIQFVAYTHFCTSFGVPRVICAHPIFTHEVAPLYLMIHFLYLFIFRMLKIFLTIPNFLN